MHQAVDDFIDRSTPASRCLIPVMVATPVLLAYLIGHGLALASPDISAALRPGPMWLLQGILALSLVVFAWAGAWLWPRRRSREPQPLASIAVALAVGVSYTAITIMSGSFTAGSNLVMLGAMANGLLLFDRRTMLIAFWTCLGGLFAYDGLAMGGLVPYAPAVTEQAFVGNAPQWWLSIWRNAVFYIGLIVIVTMLVVLFGRLDAVHQKLSRLSYTDVLTGLANRRHFMDRLHAEVLRQRRTNRPLSLIMIDVDHFKQVNDTHGHSVGDEVLTTLSMLMLDCVRNPTDLTARIGGEEFAILLPDASIPEARVVCERLQQRLALQDFWTDGHRSGITVSMGIAQGSGQTMDTLMHQADQNLYRAKLAGRNRSIASDGSEMAA